MTLTTNRDQAVRTAVSQVTETAVKKSREKISEQAAKALRQSLGRQHGIPALLAERLNGSTEEELTADAEKLAAHIAEHRKSLRPAAPQPAPVAQNASSGGSLMKLMGAVFSRLSR